MPSPRRSRYTGRLANLRASCYAPGSSSAGSLGRNDMTDIELGLHPAVAIFERYDFKYPTAWRLHDRQRQDHLGECPAHVYAPGVPAMSLVRRSVQDAEQAASEGFVLAALAAWRPTQGIYRFAPALLDALLATPIVGNIPVDLLRRLPEWCVYVEINREIAGRQIRGAWAHFDASLDPRRKGSEGLCFVIDRDGGLESLSFPLRGTLDASFDIDPTHVAEQRESGLRDPRLALTEGRQYIEGLLSVLLYLCSVNAELHDPNDPARQPGRPRPRRNALGKLRIDLPKAPTVWETGTRIGAALDAARQRGEDAEDGGDVGRSKLPHIRRAHWHHYWVGSRDSIERRLELRWLHPILVGLEPGEPPPVATVRPIS